MMRVEYGVDRDGDGQVDDDVNGYTPDPTTDLATNTPDAFPEDWADVVMARVSLVVRNTESSGGFVDDKIYTIAGDTYCDRENSIPAMWKFPLHSKITAGRSTAGRWVCAMSPVGGR